LDGDGVPLEGKPRRAGRTWRRGGAIGPGSTWPGACVDSGDELAAWRAECEASRKATAARNLSDTGLTRRGEPCSLRWIYVHMIEEYARHNGHADLIRELTDGAVGW
jgi:hypothetical protein